MLIPSPLHKTRQSTTTALSPSALFSSKADSEWLPSSSTTTKLFITGTTVGPLVDSLHNQCLLKYDMAPIAWGQLSDGGYLLCSSWTVPPLLGFAYVVLGGVLPRLFTKLIRYVQNIPQEKLAPTRLEDMDLQTRALWAVTTTALIIKLSDFLERSHILNTPEQNVAVLLVVAFAQWALLDASWAALLAASITAFGGPLSELPFVAYDVWEYLPQAGDYLPLHGLAADNIFTQTLLNGRDVDSLALSSITGPCYFAVTMDAIALGRWFDGQQGER